MGHSKRRKERWSAKKIVQRSRLVCRAHHEVPFKKREEVRNFKSISSASSPKKRLQDPPESEGIVGGYDSKPVQIERPQEDHPANLFSTKKVAVQTEPTLSSRGLQQPFLPTKKKRDVPQHALKHSFKASKGGHSLKPISAFLVQGARLGTSPSTSVTSTSRSCKYDIPHPSSNSPQDVGTSSARVPTQCETSPCMDSSPTVRNSPLHKTGVNVSNKRKVEAPRRQLKKGFSVDNNKDSSVERRRKKFNCHPLIERLKCVMEVTNGGLTIDQACDKYEISARTFYRWKANKEHIARFVYDGENSNDAQRKKYPDREVCRGS